MNEFQQTFVMSMASNQAPNLVGQAVDANSSLTPIQQAAQLMVNGMVNTVLPKFFGYFEPAFNHSIVWGPAVYIDPDKDFYMNTGTNPTYNATATNTMVVFQTAPGNYVIAIAGTKATSIFDQVAEDGKVLKKIDWPYGQPKNSSAKISAGTGIGVDILLNTLKDPKTGKSIAGFLQSINSASNTITVTGHSLGGALAPALALALFGSSSNQSTKLLQKARIYMTAPPDTGNQDYCNYLSQSFKPTGSGSGPVWQQYNLKIWNSFDVVPQAWANLNVVKDIYNRPTAAIGIPTPAYINCIITLANTFIDGYTPMDASKAGQFGGTFLSPSITPGYDCNTAACSANKLPDHLCDFVAEMLYQHIGAYFAEFGLPVFSIPEGPCEAATNLYKKNLCSMHKAEAESAMA